MPDSLSNRLKCLVQGWNLGAVRPSLPECLWRPFEYHGVARRRIRREVEVTLSPEGDSVIRWRDYVLYWPGKADLDAFCTIIAEIFTRGNAHYFFSDPIRIRPGDVIIDVGACEGLFALRCAVEFHAGRVLAVEPSATMRRLIARSFSDSRKEGVLSLVPCVAGAVDGRIAFLEDPSNPALSRVLSEEEGGAGNGVSMAMQRLDTMVASAGVDRVDLVKVDAEGADLEILRGAEGLLRRYRPQLAVATYHTADHAREMHRFLSGLGLGYHFRFQGLVAREGAVRPVLMLASVPGREA